jgi:hypothetical protein
MLPMNMLILSGCVKQDGDSGADVAVWKRTFPPKAAASNFLFLFERK